MSSTTAGDNVIIGGGAAGLSLAKALSRTDRPTGRTLVLEPRPEYVRDRTWCYWAPSSDPPDPSSTHRWRKWRVRSCNREITVVSSEFEYRHVPADAFYRNALSEIAQSPDAELRLETRVLEIVDLEDGAVVHTNHGEIYAKRVFDSRPRVKLKDRNTGHIDLQQHFVGWHVKTKDNVFDPNVVTLMDFKERDEALIQFFYVLPFAHDEALVEATFISRTTLPEEHYEHELQSYLEDLGSSDGYRVLWKERGRIPMSTRPTPTRVSPHVYTIGGAAGLVKPSTGYGFLGIQRYSQALASRLTSASLPQPPRVRSRLMATLDRIFLSVIDRYPALAPSIFSTLFQGVDADALVRFLSDRPQPGDVMAVVNAMPKWPFIRQAFLSAPVWLSP